MVEFSDEQIVLGIKDRSNDVAIYLEKKYRLIIITMIMERGGTSTDGEDIFSDGIVGLIEMVSKKDFTLTCKLSSLFIQICKFQWENILKSKKAGRNYQIRNNLDTEVADFSDELDKPFYRRIYDECFADLGKECKQILNAYFKEHKAQDIAEVLGFSYTNLRGKKSKCYASLRKLIDKHPEYVFLQKHEGMKMNFKSKLNE